MGGWGRQFLLLREGVANEEGNTSFIHLGASSCSMQAARLCNAAFRVLPARGASAVSLATRGPQELAT